MGCVGTKRTRSESTVSTDAQQPSQLAEDTVEEILLRLPAKSVLRCRAVCRAWRRLASDPRFLAAHARLRPAEPVLCTYLDAPRCDNRPRGDDAVDIALDVLPVHGEEACRRLIRYPKLWKTTTTTTTRSIAAADEEGWQLRSIDMALHCLLLASCDGVLLFKKARGLYLLCNPVTRQWAELPRLLDLHKFDAGHDVEFAFYFHQPSGEYRLLCNHRTVSTTMAWSILSTGAAEPRRVDTHAEGDGFVVVPTCLRTAASAPAALHGRLHWAPQRDFNGDETCTKVVTFDTLSETFQTMTGPPTKTSTLLKLFVTDGIIVVADFEKTTHVDLWFLEDYGVERWERRHQVAMPRGIDRVLMGLDAFRGNFRSPEVAQGDDQGNVVLRGHGGLVVYNVRMKKTVRADKGSEVLMSRHGFRESLVQHPCFVDVPVTDNFPLIHFWY